MISRWDRYCWRSSPTPNCCAFGPLHNAEEERFAPEGSPISQALRFMGARRGSQIDEFAAVGLGRHRHHEGWLLEIGVELPEQC
jgi:hypothetical protein